jgi:hypothetical protein
MGIAHGVGPSLRDSGQEGTCRDSALDAAVVGEAISGYSAQNV